MRAHRCALLAVVIPVISLSLPAAAQERGSRAAAEAIPPAARAVPAPSAKRDDRRNLAVAKRMTDIPEFVEALRSGDAKAAKRIFVANGGSEDQVILVPVRGWNPTTGYNASDPFPVETPRNPVVCHSWRQIPWGWNISTQKFDGFIWACWGPGKHGIYGWQ